MYELSLKNNNNNNIKILPWLQGPPFHTPLLTRQELFAGCSRGWCGAPRAGQSGQEAGGAGTAQDTEKRHTHKNKKRLKKAKKSFYCIFVIHTNALLYVIFFIPWRWLISAVTWLKNKILDSFFIHFCFLALGGKKQNKAKTPQKYVLNASHSIRRGTQSSAQTLRLRGGRAGSSSRSPASPTRLRRRHLPVDLSSLPATFPGWFWFQSKRMMVFVVCLGLVCFFPWVGFFLFVFWFFVVFYFTMYRFLMFINVYVFSVVLFFFFF